MDNKIKGREGESLVVGYLLKYRYKIIDRNWTCRWGELDIVAGIPESLVFIEVKYRSSYMCGEPFESLTYFKRRSLYRAIQNYLCTHNDGKDWRFDLITLKKIDNHYFLSHYKSLSLT